MKFIGMNKIYGKLKMKCFEIPNASYTNRCAAYKKSQPSVKHIWFLPTRKANAEKPKELAFSLRSPKLNDYLCTHLMRY
jgi:hypothetical protein